MSGDLLLDQVHQSLTSFPVVNNKSNGSSVSWVSMALYKTCYFEITAVGFSLYLLYVLYALYALIQLPRTQSWGRISLEVAWGTVSWGAAVAWTTPLRGLLLRVDYLCCVGCCHCVAQINNIILKIGEPFQ